MEYETARGEKVISIFLKSLPAKTQARFVFLAKELTSRGPILGMPYSKKIANHLYELRIKGSDQVRLLYSYRHSMIYLLHGFKKKTEKIPIKELKIGIKRLKEID